ASPSRAAPRRLHRRACPPSRARARSKFSAACASRRVAEPALEGAIREHHRPSKEGVGQPPALRLLRENDEAVQVLQSASPVGRRVLAPLARVARPIGPEDGPPLQAEKSAGS